MSDMLRNSVRRLQTLIETNIFHKQPIKELRNASDTSVYFEIDLHINFHDTVPWTTESAALPICR